MDFLAASVVSGIVWDVIKQRAKVTAEYLRTKLKNWILDEKDYDTIAKVANEVPEGFKKTEKFLEAYFDDNTCIKEILSRAKPSNEYMQSNNTFNQSANQQGNNNTQNVYIGGEHNQSKKT